jgi:hypothetical protein
MLSLIYFIINVIAWFLGKCGLREIVIPDSIGNPNAISFKIPACARMTTTLLASVNGKYEESLFQLTMLRASA